MVCSKHVCVCVWKMVHDKVACDEVVCARDGVCDAVVCDKHVRVCVCDKDVC